jgi:hypothetical protein
MDNLKDTQKPQQASPEEVINEILSRWTVTDLVEQTDADLRAADERFYKSESMKVVDQGQEGAIKWWKIESGGKTYEVRRFKNFCFCSCAGFFFNKRACKHISSTALVLCANCKEMSAKVGKYCYGCDANINRFSRAAAESQQVR